jgi:ketosteroid isomerase-like protein
MKHLLITTIAILMFNRVDAQDNEGNAAVVSKIFAAFNAHRWEEMMSFYAPDAVFEDPAFKTSAPDRDQMVEHHRQLQSIFPDIRDEVKAVYSFENKVVG